MFFISLQSFFVFLLLLLLQPVRLFSATGKSSQEHHGNHPPVNLTLTADVVIWGGTICGFTSAITVARMNRTAIIVLEYGDHFGGMTSGGLSAVDLNMHVGGLFLEFANRAGMPVTPFPSIEAKVASATMKTMIDECGDSILIVNNTQGLAYVTTTTTTTTKNQRNHYGPVGSSLSFDRTNTTVQPPRILSFTTQSGTTITGRYFIDCSYEGDLLQQSGAPFTYGRESSDQYNETLAGSEGYPWTINRYAASISPWVDTTNTTLLPTVAAPPVNQNPGTGDDLVMSYNYRLCLTNNATIAVPLDPPPGYNASYVELLRRWWIAEDQSSPSNNLTIGDLFLIRDLPGGLGKIDVNDGKMLFGTDMPFLQRFYPTGNWTTRQSIAAAHEWWMRALFTFLRTDDSGAVPAYVRQEITQYGLCGDEFLTTDHWPPQLYVRESVRLVGDTVLTEHDTFGTVVRTSNSSIGLSRWLVDIHSEERIAVYLKNSSEWLVADAGDRNTVHDPWQLTEIPYEVILPPRFTGAPTNFTSLANLLVPVCASMSHVGYATYRLEAQYAIIGQSAAVAAVLALNNHSMDLHDVSIPVLQNELIRQGQLINATQPPPPPSSPALVLQSCEGSSGNGSNPLQSWSYVTTDSTIRLSSAAAIDPTTAVYIWSAVEDPGAWEPPRRGLLSPAQRLLKGGRHVRGALTEICASVYGYHTTSGTPIWAVTCHTNDTNPLHQNQEYDVVPMVMMMKGRERERGRENEEREGIKNEEEEITVVQIRSKLSGLCLTANLTSMGLVQGECSAFVRDENVPVPTSLWLPLAVGMPVVEKKGKKEESISIGGWWQLAPNSNASTTALCVTMNQ